MGFLQTLKRLGRKAVGKIKGESNAEIEQDQAEKDLLDKWQRIFAVDRTEKDPWDEWFDRWEELYAGDRQFNNVNSEQEVTPRTLVNFPKRFIELHLDLNIPEPEFKPVAQDDENAVKRLESQVKYTVRSAQPSLEEMNQQDERRVRKLGGCFKKVHWNNNIKRAGFIGDVEISNPHPKDIIPNAGATSIDDMEHYHHVVNHTGNHIVRRFKNKNITLEMLEKKAALYEEYDEQLGSQDINVSHDNKHEADSGLAKYSVVETTYRDEEGDICKLWWSGDLILDHVLKFYYRRDAEGKPISEETYQEKTVQAFREWGKDGPQFTDIPPGNPVPLYIPNSWDLVYQPFIPRDKCFWGMSVYEDVADIVESIKKQIYAGEEEILKGRTKIFTTDQSIANRLKDPYSEVIVCEDLNLVKEVQFTGDLAGHMAWLALMKGYLQELMGAEDPVLGKSSSDVTSGKQAQMYINQSQAMTDVTVAGKIAAYKRLYRVIADFHLAFSDYDRPFRLDGAGPQGADTYGTFNRLNMLRDRGGNIVYPDWDIEIGAESGFMRSKSEILQAITWLATTNKFEPNPQNLVLLRILDKIGIPHLKEAIKSMEDAAAKAEAAQKAQQAQMEAQAQAQAQAQAAAQAAVQGGGVQPGQPMPPGGVPLG